MTSTQQQAQLTQQPRLEQGLDLLGLGGLLPELLNIPELGGLYPDLRSEEPQYESLENIIGDTILDPSLIAALRDDPLFDATNSIKQPAQNNPQPREKVILSGSVPYYSRMCFRLIFLPSLTSLLQQFLNLAEIRVSSQD